MQVQKPTIREQAIGITTGLAVGTILYKTTTFIDKKH